jgi:hypothetical protein
MLNTENHSVKGYCAGNSVEQALRRLRSQRQDLHARVLAGELSANAAMVEAGFRKPRPRDPMPGLSRLRRAWDRATPAEREAFMRGLTGDQLDGVAFAGGAGGGATGGNFVRRDARGYGATHFAISVANEAADRPARGVALFRLQPRSIPSE